MKLRNQYKYLTLILVVMYLVVSVLGWINVGDYNDVGDTMFYFAIMGIINFVFSLFAFIVTIPKKDEYVFKSSNTKAVAEVSALSVGTPAGGIGNSFKIGPRARYILTLSILGGILVLGSVEFLPFIKNYESSDTSIITILFVISLIAEIVSVYGNVLCHKYHKQKINK